MINAVCFDVAGTLIYKQDFFERLSAVLNEFGYHRSLKELKEKHKFLTEIIDFPDETSESFYNVFNSQLLICLGIIPNIEILNRIFKTCSYLKWTAFEDTIVLSKINIPIYILSNFNSNLNKVLNGVFEKQFEVIWVSADLNYRKPDESFYSEFLKRNNLDPAETLYIGDSFKLDYCPAKNLGINVKLIDRDSLYPLLIDRIGSLQEIINLL